MQCTIAYVMCELYDFLMILYNWNFSEERSGFQLENVCFRVVFLFLYEQLNDAGTLNYCDVLLINMFVKSFESLRLLCFWQFDCHRFYNDITCTTFLYFLFLPSDALQELPCYDSNAQQNLKQGRNKNKYDSCSTERDTENMEPENDASKANEEAIYLELGYDSILHYSVMEDYEQAIFGSWNGHAAKC